MNSDYVLPRKPIPSEEYNDLLDAYKEMHKEAGYFKGISLVPFISMIQELLETHDCKTLMDYGCGKGLLYTDRYKEVFTKVKEGEIPDNLVNMWKLDDLHLYDPAYPEFNKLPTQKYDAIICTDVLEHIPATDLSWVVEEILSFGKKIVFINVCTQAAAKAIPVGKYRGRNVHVSLFNMDWWLKTIRDIWKHNYTHLKVFITCSTGKQIEGYILHREKEDVIKPTT